MTYAKQTWTNGAAGNTPINATRLNYMENGIAAAEAAGLATMPKAMLYASASQTNLPANWSKISIDAASIDTHSALDTVNKGFKVPVGQAGIYMIDGSMYANGVIATYLSTIYINGSAVSPGESGGGAYMANAGYSFGVPTGARLHTLNAGDVVTLMGYSTVAGWTSSVTVRSWMSVIRVA